jgi:hypothetical protein
MPKRGYGKAEVAIVGRYFSGTKQTLPGGTFWLGYGHMGLSTLLVIEQSTGQHRAVSLGNDNERLTYHTATVERLFRQ